MAKKNAKKAPGKGARKAPAKKAAPRPKAGGGAKRKPAPKKSAPRGPAPMPTGDKTGAALHSLLGDLRGGPMKSEEE